MLVYGNVAKTGDGVTDDKSLVPSFTAIFFIDCASRKPESAIGGVVGVEGLCGTKLV